MEGHSVSIRILSPRTVRLFEPKVLSEELIIHIHGGGWISGSSFSSQIFTRQWANIIDRPIFAIDYRLAPKHKYPAAISDCWQAYNWLVDHAKYFGINPKRIILIGDSAGGNLAVALQLVLMKSNRRTPDAIILPYPGLLLNLEYFTPSFVNAMHDPMVSYSTLEFFVTSYLSDVNRGTYDPAVSPLITPDNLLKKFPMTRFIVGGNDPLHDETWRMVIKLLKQNRDVKLLNYLHMPHGFLMLDFPGGMNEAKMCIKDCGQIILDVINDLKHKALYLGKKIN